MLGSISATDGHACMLRAMCEVCKLLSSHTGAILRKKSSLIVWQFHVRLEQFWPKIITNCLSRWCLFPGERSSFPLWRSAGRRSEPSSLCEPRSRWGGDRGGGWQLSGLYGRSGGGHGEAHFKYNHCTHIVVSCRTVYLTYIEQKYTWPVTTVCTYKIQVSGDCSSYGRLCPISFFDFLSNGINSLWVLNQKKEAFSNSV